MTKIWTKTISLKTSLKVVFSDSVQSRQDVECCVSGTVTASGPPARA